MDDRVRRHLAELRPPPDALRRTLRRVKQRELRQRVAVGTLALGISFAGVLAAIRALPLGDTAGPIGPNMPSEPSSIPSTDPVPVPEGIVFEMEGDIYVIGPNGARLRNLTQTADLTEFDPTWAPQGHLIAYVACRICDQQADIYVMNADGTEKTRLTNDEAIEGGLAWSPDGSTIAFDADSEGSKDLFTVNADGTGRRRLKDWTSDELTPSWSPDGSRIAYTRLDGTLQSAVYILNTDGTALPLTDDDLWAQSPVWSPDGQEVAFNVLDAETTPDI